MKRSDLEMQKIDNDFLNTALDAPSDEEIADAMPLKRPSGDLSEDLVETAESKTPDKLAREKMIAEFFEDDTLPTVPLSVQPAKAVEASNMTARWRRCGVYTFLIPFAAFIFVAVVNDVVTSFSPNNQTLLHYNRTLMPTASAHQLAADCCVCNASNTTPTSLNAIDFSGGPTPTPTAALNLDAGMNATRALRQALEDYYGGLDVLDKSFIRSLYSVNSTKARQRLSAQFARAIVWDRPFVVGAIGSSVTAGHDNCNFDSYEKQLERTMTPVFDALGASSLVVRNAGQGGSGGDTYKNQLWCLRNLVGDDVDAVHYSWTYFENSQDKHEFHEMFVRWAALMERQPIALIINTGIGEGLDFETDELMKAYVDYDFNKVFMQRGLSLTLTDYPGKKWGRVGDGTGHTTTRYGSMESDDRKNSLGIQFRNWHPGPLGFELLSDAIALQYLEAISDALGSIEGALAAGIDPKINWPEKRALVLQSELPAGQFLSEAVLQLEELPSCTDFELPTYGPHQIDVMSASDPFNDDLDLYRGDFENFEIWQAPPSTLIPRSERHMEKCAHLDFVRGYRKLGGVETNPISFRLPRMKAGIVAFCGLGKKAGQQMLDSNATVHIGGQDVSHNLKSMYGKCVQAQGGFHGNMTDPSGHLVMSIQFPKHSQTVTITHVLAM